MKKTEKTRAVLTALGRDRVGIAARLSASLSSRNVQIERSHPGSFLLPDGSDSWAIMLYYSLVTMTTLGYGDILPLTPLAMMAAGFEAVIGVLYIAVMVGSIVGNLKANRAR